MNDQQLEPVSDAFKTAVNRHQTALEQFGEDDPRTVDAMLHVMLLAPDWLFAELEEITHAPRH